jgi:hypothetical protein
MRCHYWKADSCLVDQGIAYFLEPQNHCEIIAVVRILNHMNPVHIVSRDPLF